MIPQIGSYLPLYNYKIEHDLYRYGSKNRKYFKQYFGIKDMVEDHHIIPKEFRKHKFIRNIDYDVSSSRNIKIMCNHKNHLCETLTNRSILIHHNGHIKYNLYVGKQLDKLVQKDLDIARYEFYLFIHYLESMLDINNDNIPWK
jgi:hypothetical protein